MRAPEEYRAARAAATHWLQLRIESPRPAMGAPGVCVVRAEVLRSFRGPAPAARGIELEIECKPRGERSPPGDEFRLDLEDLTPGRVMEAFVDRAGERYRVAARQIDFIAIPGEKPAFHGKE